ncbi:STING domain-containing protein [Flavobacterium sp. LB3P122]|uniref:STING domain-containing protein n=1 Tax=Flavobacterium algoriphilum TaxID=3398738 RepID=UPI003A85E18B
MTDLKPKIFIGSSTAGLPIAQKVKNYLSVSGNCFLWKEKDIWEPNRSTFDNLIRMSNYFDFGIFVATADDLTLTNDKLVIESRDNVILEMSIFLGAMGHNKSFLLVEEGLKLPTDFNGIYMPRFNRLSDESISNACDSYIAKINEHYSLGHLSLYPTTALAIGYYKNFVADLVESLQTVENLEIDGNTYSDFKLKIVIPKNLKGMIREKASMFYKRNGFIGNQIKAKFRSHFLWFQFDQKNKPNAIMYDMPSTLTGVDDAIELILQKGFKGRTKMQELIEEKELNNFRRVLQMQIDESPFAQAIVEIVDEF